MTSRALEAAATDQVPPMGGGIKGALEPKSLLLTPIEAAVALGVGRTKLYELISSGRLFSVRIDGCRRVPRVAIDAFVAGLMANDVDVHKCKSVVSTASGASYRQTTEEV